MAKTILGSITKDYLLNSFRDLVDSGGEAAYLEIYTGTMPENNNEEIGNSTLLGKILLKYPSGNDSTNGVLKLNFEKEQVASKSGIANWARLFSSDKNSLLDLDVGTKDTTLILNDINIVKGGIIQINAMVIVI